MTDSSSANLAPAIQYTNVSRRYGKKIALDAVSFEVMPGECFGLVGGNGAGKTTLLKCMLDFIAPQAGDIRLFGIPSTQVKARARLAYLPERFLPPYYLKGIDFLKYMAGLHAQPFDRQQVERMMAALDLERDALMKPARAYSKGMTQKLGLSACLLSNADLLVFDEPATGLDPKARVLLKAQISHSASQGRCVFLTSHSLADVDEMCQRMAILHRGRLRFVGTPQALRQRYAGESLEAAYLACIEQSDVVGD